MPTKTAKGNHLKSHNRSASATTHNVGKYAITGTNGLTGLPHPNANADVTRTKSAEKIRRTGSDVQLPRVKNALLYTAYQQHPVHQAQSDRGTGYQSRKRGKIDVQINSDGDDDEWVSSESGAVTPADNEEDGPPTPKETINVVMQGPQQLSVSPSSPIVNPTGINSASRNLEHNPSNMTNTKPSHIANVNGDSDMTMDIQAMRPTLPQLQLQFQTQLHPMTRTQGMSTAAKQRTASGPRKHSHAPVTHSDPSALTMEKVELIQSRPDNVDSPGANPAAKSEPEDLDTSNNQTTHSQPQVPSPELEQVATPRVRPSSLRPSEASHNKVHARPQFRPRPQSMADIRLIDTNAQSRNEEADDVSVQSPATEHPPSRTRPPSTRSIRSLYHHPLIRTRSYAPSTPTLAATASPAFSPATASPTLTPNAGMTWSNVPSNENSHYFWPYKLKRQNSQSSVNSVATLPLTSAAAVGSTSNFNVTASRERPRTLSHTSAALSSLAAAAAHQSSHHYFGVPGFVQHAPSRPASPPLLVMFPPPLKSVHSMLPAALTETHLSATAFQRIMEDSFARIRKAKARREMVV